LNELSTEVKARETHEKAVGYFKVSEQYGYKFIMEVKKIRDDRYYKELGFNTFEEYCQKVWGFERSWVYKKIQAASKLSETDFVDFNQQFGQQKTFLLATMEDEQRKQATEKGIPTKEGYKSIDKATQNEINEYKRNAVEAERRAKQAESQAEQARKSEKIIRKKLENLEDREPKVIEKEIIKEVDKTDYDRVRSLEEQIKRMKANDRDVSEKEKEVKLLQLDASKSVLKTKITIDDFLQDVAVTSYRRGAIAASSDSTKNKLREGLDDLKNFIKEMEMALDGTIEH